MRVPVIIQDIIDASAEMYGCDPEDVVSKNRLSEYLYPRQISHYIACNATCFSRRAIGSLIGGVYPQTVYSSWAKIDYERKMYHDIDFMVSKIESKLKMKGHRINGSARTQKRA